ncbi:hypothetical protein F4811DRAFT_509769 [Daldinia bambusicola]|nr:hypothetical protein F4811DRAFT_509769 [Daldinia bambusicola]
MTSPISKRVTKRLLQYQHVVKLEDDTGVENIDVIENEPDIRPSDTAPSTLKDTLKWPVAPSKTSSDLVRGARYPRPPAVEYAPGLTRCEWCFECYATAQFRDTKWWKRHVNRDLIPYVCLSEDCSDSMVQFDRFEDWKAHMNDCHSTEWAEKIHSQKWACDICHPECEFSSSKFMGEHMHGMHGDVFTDIQIEVLTEQSAVQTPRPRRQCPLCCFRIDDNDTQFENRDLNNDINIPNAQSVADDSEMTGRRPEKKVRFNIPLSHNSRSSPQPMDNTEGKSNEDKGRPQPQPQSGDQCHMQVALHVAKHLQALCLTSLRLKALDPYTNIELEESTDYVSHGAPSSAASSAPSSQYSRLESLADFSIYPGVDILEHTRSTEYEPICLQNRRICLAPWEPRFSYNDIDSQPLYSSSNDNISPSSSILAQAGNGFYSDEMLISTIPDRQTFYVGQGLGPRRIDPATYSNYTYISQIGVQNTVRGMTRSPSISYNLPGPNEFGDDPIRLLDDPQSSLFPNTDTRVGEDGWTLSSWLQSVDGEMPDPEI